MAEPNYAINLELAELVNTKKANTYVIGVPAPESVTIAAADCFFWGAGTLLGLVRLRWRQFEWSITGIRTSPCWLCM
jgi:hypothetical protein